MESKCTGLEFDKIRIECDTRSEAFGAFKCLESEEIQKNWEFYAPQYMPLWITLMPNLSFIN